MNHGYEYEVEISKEKDKGVAVLKLFGPNGKKEHTIMINQSRKHDVKFVEILAMEIIKPLLDKFENGEGWKNLLKSHPALTCNICNKTLCTEKNLKNHMGKIHGTSDLNFCNLCDFKSHLENDLTIHLLNHKSDNLDIESENEKEGIKRNRNISGSSNSTTSPPMKKTSHISNLPKDEVFSSVTTSNATADDEFKPRLV